MGVYLYVAVSVYLLGEEKGVVGKDIHREGRPLRLRLLCPRVWWAWDLERTELANWNTQMVPQMSSLEAPSNCCYGLGQIEQEMSSFLVLRKGR